MDAGLKSGGEGAVERENQRGVGGAHLAAGERLSAGLDHELQPGVAHGGVVAHDDAGGGGDAAGLAAGEGIREHHAEGGDDEHVNDGLDEALPPDAADVLGAEGGPAGGGSRARVSAWGFRGEAVWGGSLGGGGGIDRGRERAT